MCNVNIIVPKAGVWHNWRKHFFQHILKLIFILCSVITYLLVAINTLNYHLLKRYKTIFYFCVFNGIEHVVRRKHRWVVSWLVAKRWPWSAGFYLSVRFNTRVEPTSIWIVEVLIEWLLLTKSDPPLNCCYWLPFVMLDFKSEGEHLVHKKSELLKVNICCFTELEYLG